ncbi:unnamed protein product, partial [Aphanomyces euteiches]
LVCLPWHASRIVHDQTASKGRFVCPSGSCFAGCFHVYLLWTYHESNLQYTNGLAHVWILVCFLAPIDVPRSNRNHFT